MIPAYQGNGTNTSFYASTRYLSCAIRLQAGVRNIVLTLGAEGAALCTAASSQVAIHVCHMPALKAQLANTSGAGDCLVAGACMRLLEGGGAPSALAHGMVNSLFWTLHIVVHICPT